MKSALNLEPKFLIFMLENPTFIPKVQPSYFSDSKVRLVFDAVRDFYLNANKSHIVPTDKQIITKVRMMDPDKTRIDDSYLKKLLTLDLSEYQSGSDDQWLRNSFTAWCKYKNSYFDIEEAIDNIRSIDPLNPESVDSFLNNLRELYLRSALIDFSDSDLGLDFFDPDSHIQDAKHNKIPTGWPTLNELMSGGWDLKTLNVIIGPSNSGKSLWLCNVAANALLSGKNVVYYTLEMSDKKITKRIGSKLFSIPVNEYDIYSKDKTLIEKSIKKLKSRVAEHSPDGDLFSNNIGRLYVKEFPTGTAKIADIDAHLKNLQDTKNVKIDMVVVDYLTILSPNDTKNGNLFQNGKQIAEGLRAISQKHNLAMITAMQVGKDNFGAGDINMGDISESKGIVEAADTMWGIIRTDEMRRQNKYMLKLLKIRDGEFLWEKTHFELVPKYLSIEKDVPIKL
jgi:archaellum biogenesis ATPase FlaH